MDAITSSGSLKSFNSSDLSSESGLLGILDLMTDERKPDMEVCDKSSKTNNLNFGHHSIDLSSVSSHLNEIIPIPEPSNDQNIPDHDDIPMITASVILLSEDYTRVTFHGPTPRVTHIFFDFSLECYSDQLIMSSGKKREEVTSLFLDQVATSSCTPSVEFPNFCEACNMKLNVGEDVYIYRRKSSFCSYECLAVGILAEEISKSADETLSFSSSDDELIFLLDL